MWSRLDYTIFETKTPAAESRLPEIIETKLIDASAAVDDVSDKALLQPVSIQNNHHNNNNVIKNENSKNLELSDDQIDKVSTSGANNQKLDDFEQLLDSASASSNIINKKLVCRNNSDVSDDSFIVKSITNNSLSELPSMSLSVVNSLNAEASSSGVSSTNGSLLLSQSGTTLLEPCRSSAPVEDEMEEDELDATTCFSQADDFYLNFIDEIKNDWLHFRPKTPPSPTYEIPFDSDLTDKSKKFATELQMLDDTYKETEPNGYIDNVYLSQPMSFNFCNKFLVLNDEAQENSTAIKTEPTEFMDEGNDDTSLKQSLENDAVKKLLEKYQKDLENENSSEFDVNDIDFDECMTQSDPVGCSKFMLLNDDLMETFKTELSSESKVSDGGITIKSEVDELSAVIPSQHATILKEAPIAELQSHNYVLQYGSPATTNTVTLSSISNNANLLHSPNDSGMSPATTLFQQQFINSGNTIISQQTQQNKLPIVYDSNTIVLAAAQSRKLLNGPTDRNCKFPRLQFVSQF